LREALRVPKMPEKDTRVTITLSDRAYEEMETVARQKGIILSRHLAMIIEAHHEDPKYGNLVKRAKHWERGTTYEGNYKGT